MHGGSIGEHRRVIKAQLIDIFYTAVVFNVIDWSSKAWYMYDDVGMPMKYGDIEDQYNYFLGWWWYWPIVAKKHEGLLKKKSMYTDLDR